MPYKNKPKVTPVRVSVSDVKHTSPTRRGCSQVVDANGPSSLIWQTVPEVQLAGTKLVAIGTALGVAEVTVQSLQSQLANAINLWNAKIVEFDAAFDVYVANVEAHATTPAPGLLKVAPTCRALSQYTRLRRRLDRRHSPCALRPMAASVSGWRPLISRL